MRVSTDRAIDVGAKQQIDEHHEHQQRRAGAGGDDAHTDVRARLHGEGARGRDVPADPAPTLHGGVSRHPHAEGTRDDAGRAVNAVKLTPSCCHRCFKKICFKSDEHSFEQFSSFKENNEIKPKVVWSFYCPQSRNVWWFLVLFCSCQIGSTEDLFTKEWHRAIGIGRDGCNNLRTTSMDALDGGVKTSPSPRSPSTPETNSLKPPEDSAEKLSENAADEETTPLHNKSEKQAEANTSGGGGSSGNDGEKASVTDETTSPLMTDQKVSEDTADHS